MKRHHFVIVGAQRSGTTYLHRLLDDHPEICMAQPVRPEPKYFLKPRELLEYQEYISTFFQQCARDQMLGEKSTSYYENRHCAENISIFLPGCKIIFLLRNPVERALSNYFFTLEHGLESRTLEETFIHQEQAPTYDASAISVDPFDYVGRGRYFEAIEMYQDHFDREKVGVFFFEELIADPEALKQLYAFIGVDHTFQSKYFGQVFNASMKNPAINPSVYKSLEAKFMQPNKKLAALLERRLPW